MRMAFIVDGHKDEADIYASYLSKLGFQTKAFTNFDDADAARPNADPCIAIIEFAAPGSIDALGFIRRARQLNPRFPIIVVYDDPEGKSVATSVDDYFLLR